MIEMKATINIEIRFLYGELDKKNYVPILTYAVGFAVR